MNKNLLTLALPVIGKRKLPFSDSFARADGAVANGWVGTAGLWAVTSNQVAGSPGLGTEVLSDPGLESNYTGGLCDWAAAYGTPTVAQSADVHGGAKAQQVVTTALADRVCFFFFSGVASTWYLYTVWTKRTAGTGTTAQAVVEQTGGSSFHFGSRIVDAAYTQKKMSYYSPNTNQIFPWMVREYGAAPPYATVVCDDGSFKPITLADMFLTRPSTQANVIVKADWTPSATARTHCGVVARLDSTTNPQNYLLALVVTDKDGYQWSTLHKVVGGTLTTLIASADTPLVAGAYLELRCSGNTVKMYYNNAQVGADQTVNDAGILNNTIHGVFSTDGGNKLNRFFLGYG